MIRRILFVLVLIMYFHGCSTQQKTPEQMTIQGVLNHFPTNVRSMQAWSDHQFMIGNTPIIPTPAVPEERLKRHVGSSVIVSGVWHAGKEWHPTEEEKDMPMPAYPKKQIISRGDGLRLSSIKSAGR